MSKAYRRLILIIFLSSCGYKWCVDPAFVRSFSATFVEGDETGLLTNSLIAALEKSPYFVYAPDDGHFILQVAVVARDAEKIGLQRNREGSSEKKQKSLQAVENRGYMTVSVRLCTSSKKVVWGPVYLEESVDYDYVDGDSAQDLSFVDAAGVRQTSLEFSLGQLEGLFAAKEDASKDLYEKIAEKIVERLCLNYDRLSQPRYSPQQDI